MHYYGVRSCTCEPVDDLGRKYFSSSTNKEFIKDQKEHHEDYKYKIIKVFDNRKDAEYYEKFLHEKFNVAENDHFYNRCRSTLMGFSVEGTKWSREHHEHMKDTFEKYRGHTYEERFGIEKANEIKAKQSAYVKTPTHRKHLPESKMGVKLSEEHRESISKGLKKRYENKDFKKKFVETMTKVNQRNQKRKDDSEKLKALWADKETRERLWGNRRHRSSYVIKMTRPDGSSETFKGLNRMCEDHNFSKYIVREALKNGKPIEDYLKFSHTNKYTNLTGYKFELLKMES